MLGPLVVIPTFNEVPNIELMLDAVLAALPSANVLVIHDSSPDGTADVVDQVAARHAPGRVGVLRRPAKAGLGTAYIEGFAWGIERGHGVLIQMDADFQHDPASLPDLLAALDQGSDVAVGSRYVAGGSVPAAWPWRRKALSRAANLYARTALRLPVRDVTAGFRAHRATLLEGLDGATIGADGYGFQIGLTYRAVTAGASITEGPIRFGERTRGSSKMSLRIMIEAFWQVAKMTPRRWVAGACGRRTQHRTSSPRWTPSACPIATTASRTYHWTMATPPDSIFPGRQGVADGWRRCSIVRCVG